MSICKSKQKIGVNKLTNGHHGSRQYLENITLQNNTAHLDYGSAHPAIML
jgi:hypothetical protein